MSYYQYNPSRVQVRTWQEADDWINGGKHKNSHRKLSKRRVLRRADDLPERDTKYADDIVLQLYDTNIVTFHRDGTFTIRHDGHTTKTTIWDLENHSPVRIRGVAGSAMAGDGFWCSEFEIVHATDRLTLPKIQKCRVCHGDKIVINTCAPGRTRPYRFQFGNEPTWPDKEWAELPGHEWHEKYLPSEFDLKWGVSRAGKYLMVGADTVLTRTHQRPRRDFGVQPCWHGFLEPHIMFDECDNCGGTGKRDHGRRPIHTPFVGVLHISATGRVIRPIETWAQQVATLRQIRQRMRA